MAKDNPVPTFFDPGSIQLRIKGAVSRTSAPLNSRWLKEGR